MWIIKTFKTKEARDRWIKKNEHRYQIQEVFINNGHGLDVRKLRRIQ